GIEIIGSSLLLPLSIRSNRIDNGKRFLVDVFYSLTPTFGSREPAATSPENAFGKGARFYRRKAPASKAALRIWAQSRQSGFTELTEKRGSGTIADHAFHPENIARATRARAQSDGRS